MPYHLKLTSLLSIFYLLLFCLGCNAQVKIDRARCQDPNFDKKVERTISFSVPTISPFELNALGEDVIILDTREMEEYEISHIPNAKFISYKDFQAKDLSDIDKEKQLVVYCSIGYRSEKIGEKLNALGYKNVSNLYGSIFEWVNQGYEVIDKDGNATKKVHTYNKNWSKWLDKTKGERVW